VLGGLLRHDKEPLKVPPSCDWVLMLEDAQAGGDTPEVPVRGVGVRRGVDVREVIWRRDNSTTPLLKDQLNLILHYLWGFVKRSHNIWCGTPKLGLSGLF